MRSTPRKAAKTSGRSRPWVSAMRPRRKETVGGGPWAGNGESLRRSGKRLPRPGDGAPEPEHPVRDRRDLFGAAPRRPERGELALERSPLGILVRRHLERETIRQREAGGRGGRARGPCPLGFLVRRNRGRGTIRRREAGEGGARLAADAAPPPEAPLGDAQRQALGVGRRGVLGGRLARRLGEAPPPAAHGDRGD